jgi:putative ABC transport system permease protein
MSTLKQILSVTALNLRSIPQRASTSLVIAIGIAGVVAVLISVLSISRGLTRTLVNTGRAERAILLYAGAQSEVESNIPHDAGLTVADLPGIKSTADGKPMASADVMASAWLHKIDTGELSSVAFRGISAQGFAVRPEIKVVEGRTFGSGLREIIVGKAALARYKDLNPGSQIVSGDVAWTVVGVFESGGDAHESELLADSDTLLSAYSRTSLSSVTVWLESPSAFDSLKKSIAANPTLSLDIRHETEYYEQQSRRFSAFLAFIANAIAAIMAIGAMFGALNTMYSAVSARTLEIATLRALGFGALGIVVSVFAEALLLAVVGALGGATLAWLFFNGKSISTVFGSGSLTQVAFHLRIGPDLIILGIVWACFVGFIGGLLPAIRAARVPVATALRDV